MAKEIMIDRDLIVRDKYLNTMKPFIRKQLIKVLTGQRRIGKSYILKQTMQYIKETDPQASILYINMEDMSFAAIHTAADLHQYVVDNTVEGCMNYVFIDEIQEVVGFEKTLRSLLLNPIYDLYCTGSNANLLSSELSTLLSGRYIEIAVQGLSYPEFLTFHRLNDSESSLTAYLKYGGLPYLKHLELTDEVVFDYLKAIYNTIMYRDVIIRQEIRNAPFMESLTTFLADNLGSLFSAKKISDYLKSQRINVSVSQIISYLNYLSTAFLIYKVERVDVVGKKIFEIGNKFYFEDIGIRNALYEYKQADIGKIIENVVYKHLLYRGYEVRIGQLGTSEIDFVAKRKGETLYVQVCYLLHDEATIEREFGNLMKIKDNYPKVVVSMDHFSGNTYAGIRHVNLQEFLMEDK
jgi:predicted AAA+ superfamily ATPase